MKGLIFDLVELANGHQRITLETGDKCDLSQLREGEVDFDIRKHREKRSLDANAYCWVLMDKLAAKLGRTKIEIYQEAIRNIGGVSETICVKERAVDKLREGWRAHGVGWISDVYPSKLPGCKNVVLYYGSSTYDSKQMHDLIDCIVQDCKAVGIETMTPAEIEAIEKQWRETHE